MKETIQRVPRIKVAAAKLGYLAALNKYAASKDIVDMDSNWGRLADFVPGAWGGERAGRTQAMADALDEETTSSVRHPMTSSTLDALKGGGLGALGGGIAGAFGIHLLNRALTGKPYGPGGGPFGNGDTSVTLAGAGVGAGLGGSVGAIIAALSGIKARRDEMRRIGALYDKGSAQGKVTPKDPKFSALSALLLPFRGPHRAGQLQAVRSMRSGKPVAESRSRWNDAGYLALPLTGYPIGQYGQNLYTQFAEPFESDKPERKTESRSAEKEAFARALASVAKAVPRAALPSTKPLAMRQAFSGTKPPLRITPAVRRALVKVAAAKLLTEASR